MTILIIIQKQGSLWQYYRDMPAEGNDAVITDSESFKSNVIITVEIECWNSNTIKYFSNF